jgi:hypothetical protein
VKINMTTLTVGAPAETKVRELHAAFSDCLPLLVHYFTGTVDEQQHVAQLLKDHLRSIEALSGQARRAL